MKRELNVPFLTADKYGFITYVNEPFKQIFGWSYEEIVGQTISALIPNKYHNAHHLSFSRFAVTEKSTILNHPLKLIAVAKDGKEIESEHFITAEKHQGNWIFAATICPLN